MKPFQIKVTIEKYDQSRLVREDHATPMLLLVVRRTARSRQLRSAQVINVVHLRRVANELATRSTIFLDHQYRTRNYDSTMTHDRWNRECLMVRTKKPKPYRQGQLDCFCGLYSVVNAVRYLGLIRTEKQGCELMAELCALLEPESSLHERFNEGTDSDEIVRILKQIIEPQYNVKRVRPFYRVATKTRFTGFVSVLREFLKSKTGIVLVSLEGFHDHWTLISGVTSRSFIFYDSDGLQQLAFRNCLLNHQDTGQRNNRVHILNPYDTHFLWVE